jgi:hypothetical protein
MSSAWIEHVKATAAEHGIPYGAAMKIASKTYTKGSGSKSTTGQTKRTRSVGTGMSRKGPLHAAGPSACTALELDDCGKHARCYWKPKTKSCAKKPDGKTRSAKVQAGGYYW